MRRTRDFLARALLLVVSALVLVRSVRQAASVPPLYNWDMVSYSALAIEWNERDPSVVHRRTYETLERELPPDVFATLVTGDVKRARHEDPVAFTQFLAFQRERVLYTLPIHLLHEWAGVELSRATWWISRGAWLGLACLIAAWAVRVLGFGWGLAAGVLLAHAPWLVAQMSMSTPDLEATFLACVGLYLLIEVRRDLAGALLLSAAVFVRPDSLVLVTVLGVALAFLARGSGPSRRFLALWLGSTWVVHLFVARITGSHGWWPLFWSAFHGMEVFPESIPRLPDPGFYAAVLRAKLAELPYPGYEVVVMEHVRGVAASTLPIAGAGLLLGGLALVRRAGERIDSGRLRAVFFALLAGSLAHWFLYPLLGDRFFAVMFVCTPLLLLSLAARLASAERGAPATVSCP